MKHLIVVCITVTLFHAGCSETPDRTPKRSTRAAVIRLDSLLRTMDQAQFLNKLPERDFDTLVACLDARVSPGDSAEELLHPVLAKIAAAAEGDAYFIEVLFRVDAAVRSNVELSKTLPEYIEKAVILNPAGFTRLYREFSAKQRDRAIGLLTFLSNPKVIPPFRDLAGSSRDPDVKQMAGMIADSLEVYLP